MGRRLRAGTGGIACREAVGAGGGCPRSSMHCGPTVRARQPRSPCLRGWRTVGRRSTCRPAATRRCTAGPGRAGDQTRWSRPRLVRPPGPLVGDTGAVALRDGRGRTRWPRRVWASRAVSRRAPRGPEGRFRTRTDRLRHGRAGRRPCHAVERERRPARAAGEFGVAGGKGAGRAAPQTARSKWSRRRSVDRWRRFASGGTRRRYFCSTRSRTAAQVGVAALAEPHLTVGDLREQLHAGRRRPRAAPGCGADLSGRARRSRWRRRPRACRRCPRQPRRDYRAASPS